MRGAMFIAVVLALFVGVGAGADDIKKGRPKAPADHVLFEADLAGAYFVARPIKEKYDNLVKRVAQLKTEINEARIDETKARREIDQIQAEIDETIRQIDQAKLYIPGATVRTRTDTRNLPLAATDLLFVECGNVEIRGGAGPEIRCVVEKTVLGALGQDATADLDGIELVSRRSSGQEMFGFYKDAAQRPDLKHDYEQFPFKPYLDRDFTVITVKGLTHEEGNRQIELDLRNERGQGRIGSEWRRHAKLILFVPKCQGVGVRGALGGFRVQSLNCPLLVEGEGNRDYRARFEVADLGGSLTASNIPIHSIKGIKGDVSILVTAYSEDVSTSHGPNGVIMRPVPPRELTYQEIQGDLRVRACRADLTLAGISGRVDVENDFGKTVWRSTRPLASKDHRIVSQSGAIEVHLAPTALGKLRLSLFTECGSVQLPQGNDGFQSRMFSGSFGDVIRRSWHGFVSGPDNERDPESSFATMTRVPAVLRDKPRLPGVDLVSRAGTIIFHPVAGP